MAKRDLDQLMEDVCNLIVPSDGMSVSEVATALDEKKTRVAGAIRKLKEAGHIKQGGERRFARYARTVAIATKRSTFDRNNASSPSGVSPAERKPKAKPQKAAPKPQVVADKPATKTTVSSNNNGHNSMAWFLQVAKDTEHTVRSAAEGVEAAVKALHELPEGAGRALFAGAFLEGFREESARMGTAVQELIQMREEGNDATAG